MWSNVGSEPDDDSTPLSKAGLFKHRIDVLQEPEEPDQACNAIDDVLSESPMEAATLQAVRGQSCCCV